MNGQHPPPWRPATAATGGQNPPAFAPFPPPPAPNQYGGPVPRPRFDAPPQLAPLRFDAPPQHGWPVPPRFDAAVPSLRFDGPPPATASGNPNFQFRGRAPPSCPTPPHHYAQSPSLHNHAPIQFPQSAPPPRAEQYKQHLQQQHHQGNNLQFSYDYQSQQLQQQHLQSSPFNPPTGYDTRPQGAPANPGKRHLEYGECSDSKRIKKVDERSIWQLPEQQPESRMRHLEDVQGMQPKRPKLHFKFKPLLKFLKKNPVIQPFRFEEGSNVGVSNLPKEHVENTRIGSWIADGAAEEVSVAHDRNLSWAGDFDVSDMFLCECPFAIAIAKPPKEEATDENRCLDFAKLVGGLFNRYRDKNNKGPPYLDEFVERVAKLLKEVPPYREISFWVLRHHPFFMEPARWRIIIEGYYTFYKSVPRKDREALIERIDRGLCEWWHLFTVRSDKLLDLVYWKGREQQRPKYYYTRDGIERPDDLNNEIYPYTNEDGYLAVFQRHFFVHGPENALEINDQISLSSKEQAFILAYYFSHFLPGFLAELYEIAHEYKRVEEAICTYVDRCCLSWRGFNGGNSEEEDDSGSD